MRVIEFSEKDYSHLVDLADATHLTLQGIDIHNPSVSVNRALGLAASMRAELRERGTIVTKEAV